MNSEDVYDILEQIAATGARTEKEALVEQHISDPLFKWVLTMATDPMITFGITPPKPDSERVGGGVFDLGGTYPFGVLEDLRYRRLTGNAAKEAVEGLRKFCSFKSYSVLWRILSKDLRAGMTANTVNRVLPGTVPVFKVARAKHYESSRVKVFPVAVEPKFDGWRTTALARGSEVKFFTRSGKEYTTLEHLAAPVAAMINLAYNTAKAGGNEDFIRMFGSGEHPMLALDAEAMTGTFKDTSSKLRKKDSSATDAVLHVFDAVPYDFMGDDQQKVFNVTYERRRRFVEFLAAHALTGNIVATERRLAYSHEEILEIYDLHRRNKREGAMVKPLDSVYKKDQSYEWLKLKPEETEDRPIKSAVLGTGKNEGRLGALIVDRLGVDAYVGGGFSDEQREEIWQLWLDDPEALKGRLIEIEFNEITPDGNYRHSRFLRFRDDKTEATTADEWTDPKHILSDAA